MFGLFGDIGRRVRGVAFRKTLGGDFKTHPMLRKNPHAVDMRTKYHLLTKQKQGDWDTLHTKIRQSYKPFGSFHRNHFKLNPKRVPILEIPNIGGFDLLPYVSSHTPKINRAQTAALLANKSENKLSV